MRKPKLIPDAAQVAKKAWSVHLMAAAASLDFLGSILSGINADLGPISHTKIMAAGGILTLCALGARFIAQRSLP